MVLRKVQKRDEEPLASIIRQVFIEHDAPQEGTVYSDPTTDHLYELFKEPGSVLWVAEEGGNLLGCCGIFPTPGLPEGCAELVKFYLAPEARGKGIGRKLMEKSVASAIELGYTRLYIESLSEYAHAVSLYEKQGFSRLEEPLGVSGHTSCNIWMIKNLQ